MCVRYLENALCNFELVNMRIALEIGDGPLRNLGYIMWELCIVQFQDWYVHRDSKIARYTIDIETTVFPSCVKHKGQYTCVILCP